MIVVTGANGRLGRLVARELAHRGLAGGVTLASRDPASIADLASMGFTTTRVDFSDADSLRLAFAKATTILMISMSGPAEERIPRQIACIDAAQAQSVERIVYTSRVNPTPAGHYAFADTHAATEAHLRKAPLRHTIVRNNEYAENVLPALREAMTSGRLLAPGAKGAIPHVAVGEIAEALATILTTDTHSDGTYEFNGPEALTRMQMAQLLSQRAARPISDGPSTAKEFADLRLSQGRPAFMAELAASAFEAVDAGEFARVWPDLEVVLGRRPRSLRDAISELCA